MASKSNRKRDYRREYLARIVHGLASGKSRSQARGHARASDLPKPATPRSFEKENALEKALKLMKQGATQKQAAKSAGVSAERLRRFQKQNTTSRREGRRWIIVDERPVTVVMATRGKLHDVTVSHDAASDIGRHWVAQSTNSWKATTHRTSNPSLAWDYATRANASGRSRPDPMSCVS